MKRIFLSITVMIMCSISIAQMTSHITATLPAYGDDVTISNVKVPYLLYTPLEVRNNLDDDNEKFPVIIAMHGIGERTDNFSSASSVTTAELNDLYVTGLPTLFQTSTSALSGDKFKAPGRPDSEAQEFYVYAAQVCGCHSWGYPIYTDAMLDEVAKNPKADLTRVYLVGLSFGAGQVITSMQIRDISDRVAGVVAVSTGYSRFTWRDPDWSDFKNFADWGGIAIFAHSVNDAVTPRRTGTGVPLDPVTNPGSWHTDRTVDSLTNRYKGKTHVIYFRWLTGNHNGVWYRIYHPNNFGVSYEYANGETKVIGTIRNMFSLLLTRRNVKRRTD